MQNNHNSDEKNHAFNSSKSNFIDNSQNLTDYIKSFPLNGNTTLCNQNWDQWHNGWPTIQPYNPYDIYKSITTTNVYSYVVPTSPDVYILVDGNRQKVHDTTKIYLKNKKEFVIEVFNKWSAPIAMSVMLNGKEQSKLIVINPGQRLKLDRHLDSPSKFLFDTYEVENSKEAKEAIALNGNISLKFYEEKINEYEQFTWINNDNYFHDGHNINCLYNSSSSTANMKNVPYTFTSGIVNSEETKSAKSAKSIETGRIEEGSKSKQEFTHTNKSFKSFPFFTKAFQLRPLSQKPMEAKDLILLCGNCKKKQDRDANFCKSCGHKHS